jgi:shikimate kinase
MARVLLTGMSGSGKSTLLHALAVRDYPVVDTDYDGWVTSDGLWDEPRMARLLEGHATVAVSGAVSNQRMFYNRFEHVVLLSAPEAVLLERVRTRDTNPYGRTPGEQDEIRRYIRDVEPLMRRAATAELDARLPVGDLAMALSLLLDG